MEFRIVSDWCSIISSSHFCSDSESHLFMEVLVYILCGREIDFSLSSHKVPHIFCHPTVSQGHVINSCPTSRPQHLKVGAWPSSSLAWTHVVRCKQHTSKSTHPKATLKSSWTYNGFHMTKKIKALYYKPSKFVR